MKTLIIYASKKGTAKRCSEKIKKGLKGESEITTFKEMDSSKLSEYDTIILGSPVYAGTLDKDFKAFVESHEELLSKKRTFLYLSCMNGSLMDSYLTNNLSQQQRSLFKKVIVCGGAFYFSKMNFFEKFIVKKIVNSEAAKNGTGETVDGKKDVENFDKKAIMDLIQAVNEE